jgi:hypothetical protein
VLVVSHEFVEARREGFDVVVCFMHEGCSPPRQRDAPESGTDHRGHSCVPFVAPVGTIVLGMWGSGIDVGALLQSHPNPSRPRPPAANVVLPMRYLLPLQVHTLSRP